MNDITYKEIEIYFLIKFLMKKIDCLINQHFNDDLYQDKIDSIQLFSKELWRGKDLFISSIILNKKQ